MKPEFESIDHLTLVGILPEITSRPVHTILALSGVTPAEARSALLAALTTAIQERDFECTPSVRNQVREELERGDWSVVLISLGMAAGRPVVPETIIDAYRKLERTLSNWEATHATFAETDEERGVVERVWVRLADNRERVLVSTRKGGVR